MRNQMARLTAIAVCGLVVASARAADWPQWRGPNFDGSSPETGLPADWTRTDGIAWSAPLPGKSSATPVVWGDRVFVSSTDAGSDALLAMAIAAGDGRVLWRHRLGSDHKAPRNTMASPSPVTDGNVVVFLYGSGEMAGLTLDGRVLWRRDLGREFGRLAIMYGYSSSPLLYGGRLYVQMLRRPWPYRYSPGKPTDAGRRRQLDSFLLAMDPATGKTLWRHVRPTDAVNESFESYTTPLPLGTAGRTDLVLVGGDYVTGHDPATGDERWRWGYNPRHRERQRLIPSPTPGDGVLYTPLPRGNELVALEVGPEGEDVAWRLEGPTTDSATPLLYQGILYVVDSDRKDIRALDPTTGEAYGRRRLGGSVWRSSPTGADGKVYCMNTGGEVVVLEAGRACNVLSRIDMGGREVRSTIAVASGHLYIRTDDRLWCVGR